MKLRIGLLIVLCLLCLMNFKVQWDRYGQGQASAHRMEQVTIRLRTRAVMPALSGTESYETECYHGDCVVFVWQAAGVTPEPGDSWKACPKE